MTVADIINAVVLLVPPIVCLGSGGLFLLVLFGLVPLDSKEREAKCAALGWLLVLTILGGLLWGMA